MSSRNFNIWYTDHRFCFLFCEAATCIKIKIVFKRFTEQYISHLIHCAFDYNTNTFAVIDDL